MIMIYEALTLAHRHQCRRGGRTYLQYYDHFIYYIILYYIIYSLSGR